MAKNDVIDIDKLQRDVKRELEKYGRKGVDSLNNEDKKFIGEATIKKMKDLISKGISPIEGWGRFPAYKWVGKANTALKVARGLTGARRKAARAKGNKLKQQGYPYTAMKKYPDKKARPVNLDLSGWFLSKLKFRSTARGLFIGFFGEKESKYESGHRVGVNGQPQRPIIPNRQETFSRAVYQTILTALRDRLIKRLESLPKD